MQVRLNGGAGFIGRISRSALLHGRSTVFVLAMPVVESVTGPEHVGRCDGELLDPEVHPYTSPAATINRLVDDRIHMGTKSVRLSEEVYHRIEAHKREDETFSEAIDRLIDDWSLLELAGSYTEEQAERHRELLEEADELATEDHREMLERMDTGAE